VRQSDTVGRIGGDEFALVLPGVDGSQVEVVADKVFAAMTEPLEVDGTAVMLEVVLGIALWPDHGHSAAELLQHADIALRRAKAEAEPMRIFSADANPFNRRRLQLLADLRQALEQDVGLELYLQPKVDLHSGRVIGAEALARWQHPAEGPISPAEFIPLAEASGLILPFSDWALRHGIRQLAEWRQQGLALRLAINLSARNLQEPDLVDRLQALFETHAVPASQLVLEITETSLMYRPDQARLMLSGLHDLGIRLSIDDFGTGYSSLAYLKTLPVDELKIDAGFVLHMLDNDNDAVLVRTIINLGHDLGLEVVAEGVENQGIVDLLVMLGCDLAQGFYLARPRPAPEFLAWWQALPQDDDGQRFVPGLLGPSGSKPSGEAS
jgi:EAL domain-containing protein (putative c-di-GMP-specific phosphodiesterase class I)